MATSTRDDIAARVKLRLRVKPQDEMDGDTYSLQNIIDEVAGDFSRRTRIYTRRYTADLTGSTVTPQTVVCVPELYEVISLLAVLGTNAATDKKQLLTQIDIEKANRYLQQWRERPAAGYPRFYICSGPNVYLYPQPDYSCTGGLTFEGYASPLADWSGGTDVPKVPERTIDAIVYGVAGMWALEYPEVPGMATKAANFTAIYEERIGLAEAEVNRQADRAREEQRYGI